MYPPLEYRADGVMSICKNEAVSTVLSPMIKLLMLIVPGYVIFTTSPLLILSISFFASSKVVIQKDPVSIIELGLAMPSIVILITPALESALRPIKSNKPVYMTSEVTGVMTPNPVLSCPQILILFVRARIFEGADSQGEGKRILKYPYLGMSFVILNENVYVSVVPA